MPDICKCNDKDCEIKDKCYRYWSEPSYMQSYFAESPRKGYECEHYWERQPYKADKRNVEANKTIKEK